MTKEKAKERLQKLNDLKLPFGFGSILYHKNRDLYDYILEQTHFLDGYKKVTLNERIFCIMHDLEDRPLCDTCHKEHVARFFVDADIDKNHYGKFCSIKCSALSEETRTKTEATKLERYGDAHFTNREKSMATKTERYGDPYYTNRDKSMATMDERYHGDRTEITTKQKITMAKKLEEDPDMWKKREEKSMQTKLELYGDPKYNNRAKFKETLSTFTIEKKEEINQKRSDTNIEKYGCKTPLQNFGILKHTQDAYEMKTGFKSPLSKGAPGYIKSLEVKQEKYGDSQYHNREKISETTRRKFYSNVILCLTTVEPLFSLEEYATNSDSTKAYFNWRCKKCGTEFSARMSHNVEHRFVRCPTCFPLEYGTSSQIEKELVDYIKTFYNGIVSENNRQLIYPLEVDVYLPEIKLAIEFNGSYWHSDLFKDDPFYHLNKTEQCEKNSVKLIHVFESDYVANSETVKRFLKEEILFRTNNGCSEQLQQFNIKSFNRKDGKIFLKEACGCKLSNVSANDTIVVVTKDDGSIIGFAKFSKDGSVGKLIPTFFKKYSNEVDIVVRIAKHLKEFDSLSSIDIILDRCKYSLLELGNDVEFSISKPRKHFVSTTKNGIDSYIYDAGLIEIPVL